MKSILLIALTTFTLSLTANEEAKFVGFVDTLKQELVSVHGFSKDLVEKSFQGVSLNKNIIQSDRNQPEFFKSMGAYLKYVVKQSRIVKGKKYIKDLNVLFGDIYRDYPVQDRFLLSFWAMETNFSSYTGYIDIIEAFVTLIYDGRREKFFKAELIEALKILQNPDFIYPAKRIQGSWAGAIGSTQFLPSKINKYAMDYNKDGKIDMWNSKPDFLGSSARFLVGEGWDGSESWGHEIKLPANFDYFKSGIHQSKRMSVTEWSKLGVTLANGDPLPSSKHLTAVYLPQGHKGPKFLVYNNFFTVFRWNNSVKYALAIGILSDLITDRASYYTQIDLNEPSFLNRKKVIEIQKKLAAKNYPVGKADGYPGKNTMYSIQLFQKDRGLVPDGYITPALVQKILK